MEKLQEVRGFLAYLMHPPNGYLQPICTLVLALAVMGVGGSIAREAQNKGMCARISAYSQADLQHLRHAQVKKVASRIGMPHKASASNIYVAAGDFCKHYWIADR